MNTATEKISTDMEITRYLNKNKFKSYLIGFVIMLIALVQLYPLVWLLLSSISNT